MTYRHLILATLIGHLPANAVVFGHTVRAPLNADEARMREVTVRWITPNSKGQSVVCTGTQIDADTVLTAGHCITDEVMQGIRRGTSVVEAYDPSTPTKVRRLQVVTAGGDNGEQDYAIVKVRGDLPSKRSMPLAYSGCDDESRYTVAGFGFTEDNVVVNNLKTAKFAKASKHIAAAIGRMEDYTGNNLVLWPESHGRICDGDSGGPVFCKSKGQLAVAAVTKAIHAPAIPRTLRPELPTNLYCADVAGVVSATPVSDVMEEIEGLRREPRRSALPSASALSSAAK